MNDIQINSMEELLHLEIQHMKDQIDLLDAMWEEYTEDKLRQGCCGTIKYSIYYYYENLLHKLGYGHRKKE